MNDMQEACACDNWICPHNEEKIAHLPGVVKGVAWLKGRVEEMRKYWQESEATVAAQAQEINDLRGMIGKLNERIRMWEIDGPAAMDENERLMNVIDETCAAKEAENAALRAGLEEAVRA